MKYFIIVAVALALTLPLAACKKKEAPTVAATPEMPALSVDQIKDRMKTALEGAESARAGAKEPTADLVTTFNNLKTDLETLKTEVQALNVPEADKAAYDEALMKIDAAVAGLDGLAKLTEEAMAKKPTMKGEELANFSNNAKAKFQEAAEYAAPELAAKMMAPPTAAKK